MAIVKREQGMTLIELMIVIAIIAIISAIAIPAYTGYVQTARVQECQQEVASISLAEAEFFLEQRVYFAGTTTALLSTASQGLWAPADSVAANRNCEYTVALVGATGYTLTATGIQKLSSMGTVISVTK